MRKNYLSPIVAFLCGVVVALLVIKFWDPCLFCPSPSDGVTFQNSGNIPDDSLDNYIWRVFHNGTYGNFMIPYNAANLQATISGSTVVLADDGQDASYTAGGTTVKYNPTSHWTYMSSTNTISSDVSRSVTFCGPFDPTAGTFYSNRGWLHFKFTTSGTDTTLGPISHLVWLDQNVSGQPGGIAVGFLSQIDIQQ